MATKVTMTVDEFITRLARPQFVLRMARPFESMNPYRSGSADFTTKGMAKSADARAAKARKEIDALIREYVQSGIES